MDTDTTRLGGHAPPATAEILDGLNDLLQLDHDAVGAYEIAMHTFVGLTFDTARVAVSPSTVGL